MSRRLARGHLAPDRSFVVLVVTTFAAAAVAIVAAANQDPELAKFGLLVMTGAGGGAVLARRPGPEAKD